MTRSWHQRVKRSPVEDEKPCVVCGRVFARGPRRSRQTLERIRTCSLECHKQHRTAATGERLWQRFLEKIEPEPNSGCWLWDASLTHDGYGRFSVARAGVMAHRYSYERMVGPIPDGLELDHKCRIKCCVNPAHLEPVTGAVNRSRAPDYVANRTHCPQGHPYEGDNLVITKRGSRRCRICKRAQELAWIHAKRARQ